MRVNSQVKLAHQQALKARLNAYAPYSNFRVGAAVKLKGVEQIYTGSNVENASFGATMCAERVALHAAVAALGKISPEFVMVVTNEAKATVPCALCLQTLAEFCSDSCSIYLANQKGVLKRYRLKQLLPKPFRSFKVKVDGK